MSSGLARHIDADATQVFRAVITHHIPAREATLYFATREAFDSIEVRGPYTTHAAAAVQLGRAVKNPYGKASGFVEVGTVTWEKVEKA